MNTVLIPPVPTMVIQIFSWRESTSTTMKPREANMSHVPFWLILSQAPWTL